MTRSFTRHSELHASLIPGAQFDSPGQCVLSITGTTEIGPNAGQAFEGTLTLTIGSDGAIDSGTLQTDAQTEPVVGQIGGRVIRLRAGSDPSAVMTFAGASLTPLDLCNGELSGAFAGPGLQNIGV